MYDTLRQRACSNNENNDFIWTQDRIDRANAAGRNDHGQCLPSDVQPRDQAAVENALAEFDNNAAQIIPRETLLHGV